MPPTHPAIAPRARRRGLLPLAACLALLAGPVAAQERAFAPAPEATLRRDPRDLRADRAGEASLDLVIREVEGAIWNPGIGRNDRVRLRGYVDAAAVPRAGGLQERIVAPTIRVRPGDTVRMTLRNRLPEAQGCAPGTGHDRPGCASNTNMHAHGLWVSPTGNGDNVLLDLPPGTSFQYEYNIPADHPAGTFWYHPHRHGSVTLQVGSGMAGALIVEGNRKPGARAEEPGDIDVLTRGLPEKLLVFGQIPYGCFDRDGVVRKRPGDPAKDPKAGQFVCEEGQVGLVESFSTSSLASAAARRTPPASAAGRRPAASRR